MHGVSFILTIDDSQPSPEGSDRSRYPASWSFRRTTILRSKTTGGASASLSSSTHPLCLREKKQKIPAPDRQQNDSQPSPEGSESSRYPASCSFRRTTILRSKTTGGASASLSSSLTLCAFVKKKRKSRLPIAVDFVSFSSGQVKAGTNRQQNDSQPSPEGSERSRYPPSCSFRRTTILRSKTTAGASASLSSSVHPLWLREKK
jgi:hypothetical protein